jgi:hypothetical protein
MTSAKMSNTGRTSENTLFSLLIVAFIGWVAVSVASNASLVSPAAGNAVAQISATHSNS